jgi:hypothetical protein
MNRPSIGVRFAGSRPGALVLLGLCMWGVVAWYQGKASQWLMLAALMAGLWTLKCVARMRGYGAWAGAWEAMGADGAPGQVKKRQVLRWCWLLAIGVHVALIIFWPGASAPLASAFEDAVVADWFFLGTLALVSAGRLLVRRRRVKAAKHDAKLEAAPVAWLLGRASSSPSRAEAARNVPAYCAGLLKIIGG